MGKYADLTGLRFGRLVVVSQLQERDTSGSVKWLCVCDCGGERIASTSGLNARRAESCGCLHRENQRRACTKHGKHDSPLYHVWNSMIQRCTNPKTSHYEDYGGRGISVCEEWRGNAKSFLDWAEANGYKRGLTIERVNNDGNYEPSNCRWATRHEQRLNQRPRKKVQIPKRRKAVINLDTGVRYSSVTEAAETVGTSTGRISAVCKGRRDTAGGCRWRYAEKEGVII